MARLQRDLGSDRVIIRPEPHILRGSVKYLGRYAASWIAGWPHRPSSTAALT